MYDVPQWSYCFQPLTEEVIQPKGLAQEEREKKEGWNGGGGGGGFLIYSVSYTS